MIQMIMKCADPTAMSSSAAHGTTYMIQPEQSVKLSWHRDRATRAGVTYMFVLIHFVSDSPFAESESLFVTVTSTIDTCTTSKLITSINRMSCLLKLLLRGGYDATIMLLPFYSSSSSLRCIKIIRHQTRTFWLSRLLITVVGRKRLIANLECQAAY